MSNRIVIPNARLSFVNVFEKGSYQGEEAKKFEATLLVPQAESEALIAKIRAVITAMLTEKFGAKIPAEFTKYLSEKQFGQTDKVFVRDGDNFTYDGYASMWAIKAASTPQPKLLDTDKTPLTASSGKLYSGSYADAVLEPWIQSNTYGKRVNCNLLGLRHRAHGEAFGAGGVIADDVVDEFDDVEPEALTAADGEF